MTMSDDLHKIVLLDNADIYRRITDRLTRLEVALFPSGAGFAQGCQCTVDGVVWHILKIQPEHSHRLSWLSLVGFSLRKQVDTIIGICRTVSLRNSLYPGDLILIHTATALPYPALFENRDSYTDQISQVEHFTSNPDVIETFKERLNANRLDWTWQSSIPAVHSALLKHPREEKSLAPWAAEQFLYLREQGIDVLADMPVGLFEARRELPVTRLVCCGQIQATPSPASRMEWHRYQHRFIEAPVKLVLGLIGEKLSTG